MIWQIDREMALLLAGGRALLLQLAHPKIAAGVAAHSRFQENPLARLQRTMSAMWSVVFDPLPQARAALLRVKRVHQQVQGFLGAGESMPAGTPYDARDKDLLLWVHATLVDSALLAYDFFVRRLMNDERARYYEDAKKLGRLFDVPDAVQPPGETEFRAYFDAMLAGRTLSVGSAARSLAREILYPRPWILRPAAPLFRVVTAGLLPQRLRQAYDLDWSRGRAMVFNLFGAAVRHSLPLLPRLLRVVPNARVAERCLAAG